MAEEKSVLVPILIGCGLFALLCFCVCGGGLAIFVPRAMQQMEDVMQQVTQEMVRQQMNEEFPDGWRPPAAEVTDEELFPQIIGNFTLFEHDTTVGPADLGLADYEARHATYETALTKIDVYASQVDHATKEKMTQSLQENLSANFSSQLTSTVAQSNYEATSFSVSPPPISGWLWTSEGWIFLVLSEDQFAATTFLTEFLLLIQPEPPDKPQSQEAEREREESISRDPHPGERPKTFPMENSDSPPPPPQPESIQLEEAP